MSYCAEYSNIKKIKERYTTPVSRRPEIIFIDNNYNENGTLSGNAEVFLSCIRVMILTFIVIVYMFL